MGYRKFLTYRTASMTARSSRMVCDSLLRRLSRMSSCLWCESSMLRRYVSWSNFISFSMPAKVRKIIHIMSKLRKNIPESFGVSKIMLIFAASKLNCGMKTAGITSSLFCVHTYGINGITTPSPEPGNRPGVSAIEYPTARSVVSLLSKLNCYEHEELFCAREQNGAAVLLPAPGVEQVPQVDGLTGGRVAGMDGGAPGARLCLAADGAGCREVREGQGGDHQPAAHRRAIPDRHLFTATARRERIHPHRANHGAPSVRSAAHHRLSGRGESGVIRASLHTSLFPARPSSTISQPWEHFLQSLPANFVSFTNKTLSL